MNVTIIAEKPSVSRGIAPFARKRWPTDTITFVHAVPYGNIGFQYPRGLKLHEFPMLSSPRDRLRSWDEWACPPFLMADDGDLVKIPMSPDLLTSAELIVNACDPDQTGAVAFDVLMREVLGEGRSDDCPSVRLYALDGASIHSAFERMQPFGEGWAQKLEMGRLKRYFDWNWNVNSLAVFGEVQRRAGVPAGAPPLSKYALQLLYRLRNEPPVMEGLLFRDMHEWKGTGRYTFESGAWRPRLGSAASKGQIIENLLSARLLQRIEVGGIKRIRISSLGRVLLDQLHPDCEDADLPFRLHAWCEKGVASKPAVDRYINTFFGKQLRFMRQPKPHNLTTGTQYD